MAHITPKPAGRFRSPNRQQIELRSMDLESLIPDDDRARQVWAYVERLDLSPFRDEVRSVEGSAGRPAIDPAILLSVWMLACIEGVGSSRMVAELCAKHHSYQWLCGGVPVEYRTLSNFRVNHADKLDHVMSQGLAILQGAGLLEVTRIAQDGMRIRASAGTKCFRRAAKLRELYEESLQHVRQLRQELDDDPAACSRRQAAARVRGAAERVTRLEEAMATAEKLAEHQKTRALRDGKRLRRRVERPPKSPVDGGGGTAVTTTEPREPRACSTDHEARMMKFSDGGYRPAYNAQFATDVGTGVIVGVTATNNGSDCNELAPMVKQVAERVGHHPNELLADAGYCSKQDIDAVASKGVSLFTTMPTPRPVKRPRTPKDSEAVAELRARMQTEEAKQIYKQRAGAAELSNAQARKRGLYKVTVRGLAKVRPVLLLFVVVHNMMRTLDLMRSRGLSLATA